MKNQIREILTALQSKFILLKQSRHPDLFSEARIKNNWFIPEFIEKSGESLAHMLSEASISEWIDRISLPETSREVGLIMAGNIPMVGFHDLICVLASGHRARVKLSSQDEVLMKWVISRIAEINPLWADRISLAGSMKGIDALIATGSNNSARYFEYYFSHIPKIIRKNRTSVAILDPGKEDDLNDLADDIFLYFGLGCRNVSKLFVPFNFDPAVLSAPFSRYSHLTDYNSYANNHTYHHAILAMNGDKYFDFGHILLLESSKLHAPPSLLYYEVYENMEELLAKIDAAKDELQCIVSGHELPGITTIKPGGTQKPTLLDYPDNVDVMAFLKVIGE